MIFRRQYYSVMLVLIIFFYCQHQLLLAIPGGEDTTLPVNVSTISQEKSSSETEVIEYLKNAIKQSEYITLSDKARFEFIVKVQEVRQREEIIISVLTTQPIPHEVVKLAAKNEVFYKTAAVAKEYPDEGKFIREYMTSEWIKEFSLLVNFEIFSIPNNEIKLTCDKIIKQFAQRYRNR